MSIQTHKVYYKKKFSIQTKKSLLFFKKLVFKKRTVDKKLQRKTKNYISSSAGNTYIQPHHHNLQKS
jgi:hypothetical protein